MHTTHLDAHRPVRNTGTKRMPRGLAIGAAVLAITGASLGPAATEAAAQPKAPKTGTFRVFTNEVQKKESAQKFTKKGTGKVQYTLTKKQWDHAVGVRLITCGKDWKSLTAWKDFKKKKGQYYTFDKTIKDGTCFRVQSGRSAAGVIEGKVKY
ncbi:hypothetical protein ABZX40_37880 [Streptomyces sp. NPDC004610]|uniref:hypothetical protein n=1 Tax=unclassified Streptomyces TaxID=2593676 RepID=UPI0033A6F117